MKSGGADGEVLKGLEGFRELGEGRFGEVSLGKRGQVVGGLMREIF